MRWNLGSGRCRPRYATAVGSGKWRAGVSRRSQLFFRVRRSWSLHLLVVGSLALRCCCFAASRPRLPSHRCLYFPLLIYQPTMRQKRAKAYRKLMTLYSMSFGFRQPYQVLGTYTHPRAACRLIHRRPPLFHAVDSHMCKEAMTHKIELVKQLGSVLQGTVKPCESWLPLFSSPPTTEC